RRSRTSITTQTMSPHTPRPMRMAATTFLTVSGIMWSPSLLPLAAAHDAIAGLSGLLFLQTRLLHALFVPLLLAEERQHDAAKAERQRQQQAQRDACRLIELVPEDVRALDHGSSSRSQATRPKPMASSRLGMTLPHMTRRFVVRIVWSSLTTKRSRLTSRRS